MAGKRLERCLSACSSIWLHYRDRETVLKDGEQNLAQMQRTTDSKPIPSGRPDANQTGLIGAVRSISFSIVRSQILLRSFSPFYPSKAPRSLIYETQSANTALNSLPSIVTSLSNQARRAV